MNEDVLENNLAEQNQIISGNILSDQKAFGRIVKAANLFASSNIVPEIYRAKPENCFVACEMALRMNISPMMVMQNLHVIRGKPGWSGSACIGFINSCPKFDGELQFVFIGEKGKDSYGCYAQIKRKSDGVMLTSMEVTIAMAKFEGWYNKPDKNGKETSKWPSMPEQMLQYRAASFFARVHCPELLMGCQTVDEIEDIGQESKPNKTIITLEDTTQNISGTA